MKVNIYLVTVNIGLACAPTSNGEAAGIVRAFQRSRACEFHFKLALESATAKPAIRTIWAEVNTARCDIATDVIGNLHWKVVSVDQRDIIIIQVVIALQSPLGDRGRWDSCSAII